MGKMKKVAFAISLVVVAVFSGEANASKPALDINAKIAQLDIDTATLGDIIQIFGEPIKYFWGKKTFTKDNLPSTYYILDYPNGFRVVISRGRVSELRHAQLGYLWRGKLQVGSSLDEVLKVVGKPTKTVEGQPNELKDGVLYKDIDGKKGHCYYARAEQGVRFFFWNYKVTGMYVTSSDSAGGGGSLKTVRPIKLVKEFDDVRWKDISKLDLSGRKGLVATLTFNQRTVWPGPAMMPVGLGPDKLLTRAMNPGLGVRRLHQQGITGKGVNVAIIDQPLYQDHPEFAGKIVAYYDTGCGTETSMHGPAVASLLVGTNCGTAPDARVYYAAVPMWKTDSAYFAKALDWIIAQNEKLQGGEKIRVVSVSASPNQSTWANRQMWDRACARAEADGIMVLDCTDDSHRGFIGKCWYNARSPESVAQCNPWDPPNREFRFNPNGIGILVPSAPRTTAEDDKKDKFGYQYCGRGGLSWAIPYCAGVLALGWQVNPDLGPDQMRELLFKSAYTKRNGAKIINPRNFIRLVRRAKVAPGIGRNR